MTTLCLDPSDPRLAPRLEEDFPREVVALVEEEIQSRLLSLLHLLLPSSHQLNRRQAHPHLLRLGDMVRELQVRLATPSKQTSPIFSSEQPDHKKLNLFRKVWRCRRRRKGKP